MNADTLQAVGVVLAALLGGGIVKALVDFLRNRQLGRMEEHQFEYKTLSEMNSQMRSDLKDLRIEMEAERKRLRAELDSERDKRRELEDQLVTERRERQRLASRVAELEKYNGDTTT